LFPQFDPKAGLARTTSRENRHSCNRPNLTDRLQTGNGTPSTGEAGQAWSVLEAETLPRRFLVLL
jgi:hypothetical protein